MTAPKAKKFVPGKFITAEGYAPSVPKGESPTLGDDYTLVLMVRDTLQNGANPTRGKLAFEELIKRMNLPMPELTLDPEPFVVEDESGIGFRNSSAKGKYPDLDENGDPHPQAGQEWEGKFMPRYAYAQDFADYNPGPGAIGWYDDPDGSGKERWWMGIMWSDTFRDKKEGRFERG